MKICFDTSVLIDIMGETSWFEDSFAAYDVAMYRQYEPYISVSSTTDVAYLLHSRCKLSASQIHDALDALTKMFKLMDNTAADCRLASQSDMNDYEDALIAQSAQRCGVDLIVTRNKKDFASSPVPAMTPKEFLEAYQPSNVEFSLLG